MKNKLLLITLITLLFPLGDMPKGWDKPSFNKEESVSIIGVWSIDLDKVIEEYKKTPEYAEAGEFSTMAIDMIKNIFSSMKFEFQDGGTYLLNGVPNPNGESDSFEGIWYKKNGTIVLEAPGNNADQDLVFKLSGNDILVPQSKDAGMFYLLREK